MPLGTRGWPCRGGLCPARASGRVSVALATSGPGATNLTTLIADAHKDSISTLFIIGQVPSGGIGSDAFQEVDAVGVTRAISKHNYLVKGVRDLEWVLREVYALAGSGRPGPVVVDICKDVQLAPLPTATCPVVATASRSPSTRPGQTPSSPPWSPPRVR